MSFSEPFESIGPLNIGDIITAAVRIYRDRWKLYFLLALQCTLWAFVPVYGWAKSLAVAGTISRLVYGEIIKNNETLNDARRQVNARKWNLLGASILVFLIFFGVTIFVIFGLSIFSVIVGVIAGNSQNPSIIVAVVLMFLVFFLLTFLIYAWFFLRLVLFDLPIVIEGEKSATISIERSFRLTNKSFKRLLNIYGVAFLITIPISAAIQVIILPLQYTFQNMLLADPSPRNFAIYYLVMIPITMISGAFLLPFWQAIRAIVYYDLTSRKEGLDLKLRHNLQNDFKSK